jgi:hypothetical protein
VIKASKVKHALASVGGLMAQQSRKTRATALGGSKKGRFYKPLRTRFRNVRFEYRQIARQGDAAVYEQRWTGRAEPSVCYEVIRIRRRDGFQIGGRFVEPAEVYPNSEAWGVDGWTVQDEEAAFRKFSEIAASSSALAHFEQQGRE